MLRSRDVGEMAAENIHVKERRGRGGGGGGDGGAEAVMDDVNLNFSSVSTDRSAQGALTRMELWVRQLANHPQHQTTDSFDQREARSH